MRLSWSRCCHRYKSGQLPHASYPVHVCRLRFLRPAPNFGKTFGPSVTSGQSWAVEKASSLSEIGLQETTRMQVPGGKMPYATSRVRFLQTEVFPRLLHGVLLAFLREPAAVLRNLPFLTAHERAWLHVSLTPRLSCLPVPRTSPNMSGNPSAYTWAGRPRYKIAGCHTWGGTFSGPVGVP